MKIKKLAAAVAVALPVGAGLVGTALPANAALPSGCSDDLCMRVVSESGNVATIYMWADFSNFNGHFQLQMPNGRSTNSTDKEWIAGGAGYTFTNWNGGVGNWCGTAWNHSLFGGWSSFGYMCLHA